MLEGAKQGRTSDVAYACNQPLVLEDDQSRGGKGWPIIRRPTNMVSETLEPQENSRISTIPGSLTPRPEDSKNNTVHLYCFARPGPLGLP